MKILKYILFGIAAILGLILIVALFVDREMAAEATITIEKPKWEVFEYVRDIRNQEDYGVWFQADPDMVIETRGDEGEEGYEYQWESDVMGKGSQKIIRVVSQDTVLTELNFGFGEPALGYTYIEAISPDKTRVTWGMKGQTPYPFNLMNLMMDMNQDFEKGVAGMKEMLETSPQMEYADLMIFFKTGEERLLDNVIPLSPDQLQYRMTDTSWTIAECLEHIGRSEKMFLGMIQDYMTQPTNPDDRALITVTDTQIKQGVADRSQKFKAPPTLEPEGETAVPELLDNWLDYRDTIYNFITHTPVAEMRNRVNSMPPGPVDVYQTLLFLAGHSLRHTLQIEEIRSSSGFPK